eukprot:scaffold266779_cov31-Tisochrysis_lutea.AAC.2
MTVAVPKLGLLLRQPDDNASDAATRPDFNQARAPACLKQYLGRSESGALLTVRCVAQTDSPR